MQNHILAKCTKSVQSQNIHTIFSNFSTDNENLFTELSGKDSNHSIWGQGQLNG